MFFFLGDDNDVCGYSVDDVKDGLEVENDFDGNSNLNVDKVMWVVMVIDVKEDGNMQEGGVDATTISLLVMIFMVRMILILKGTSTVTTN